MSDLEERLRRLPRAPIPDSLDRTIAREIRRVRTQKVRLASLPIPLWGCGLACGLFLLAGRQLAPPPVSGPPVPVKIWVQSQDPMFEQMFLNQTEMKSFFQRPKTLNPIREGDQDV